MRKVIESRYEPTAETTVVVSPELLRVLVVDDHQDGANILSMLIKVWGHDCRRANDGATGLALAAEFQPDVVLVDILMPTMSGIEFAVLIRQQARFQNSLIVVVSAALTLYIGCNVSKRESTCT